MKAERGSGGTDPLLFNHGAGWGWVVKATPQESAPYALCMRLGGPLGRSGRVLSICILRLNYKYATLVT